MIMMTMMMMMMIMMMLMNMNMMMMMIPHNTRVAFQTNCGRVKVVFIYIWPDQVTAHFSIGYDDMDSKNYFLANMTTGWAVINGYDDLDSPNNYQSMIQNSNSVTLGDGGRLALA